jgi:elongation factor G
MRGAILLAAGALLLSDVGASRVPPGAVLWDIERRQHGPPQLYRRAKTAEEVITNERQRGGYYATVRVGTPFQDVVLQLDTGSSDTWVPSARAPVCSELFDVNPCPLGSCKFEAASFLSWNSEPESKKIEWLTSLSRRRRLIYLRNVPSRGL